MGPDGTVYIGLRLCTTVGVAVSHDEGGTWKVLTVPGSTLPAFTGLLSPVTTNNLLVSEPLALDSAGDLYVVWNDASGALRLSITKDQGQTWSGGTSPIAIAAPLPSSEISSSRCWMVTRPSLRTTLALRRRTGVTLVLMVVSISLSP